MAYRTKNNQWFIQGTIAVVVIGLLTWLSSQGEYGPLDTTSKLIITAVLILIWYFFAFMRVKKAGITINEQGIDLNNYIGPYSSLSEFNMMKLDISFAKAIKHFGWSDIESLQVGSYQRWWGFFTDFGILWGLTYLIVKSNEGYWISTVYGSPLQPWPTFKNGIISEINKLGKTNLLVSEVYKF